MSPGDDANAVIRIEGLSISLPPGADRLYAVENLDVNIAPGKTLCVVGESGSGKSMVASAIMGLLPTPHVRVVSGRIWFEGEDLVQATEAHLRSLRGRRLGMIFQEPMTSLNPVMAIGEQIDEVLRYHRPSWSATERTHRVLAALAEVDLPDPAQLLNAHAFHLSGGQRQRVMIAAAMVAEPALLIADEPTTALDVTTQEQILRLMKALQTRKGMALLFITHDFGVVEQIADEVVVMQTGRVVECGNVKRVLRQPQHPYTRTLIASIPTGQPRAPVAPVSTEALLMARGLGKTFRSGGGIFRPSRTVTAASDLSFALHEGQTLGLVGESGSGKSTVGRCLVGLTARDQGEILLRGDSLAAGVRQRSAAQRGQIQMVFQDPYASLNPRHTIGRTIAAGPLAQGVGRAEAWRRTHSLLERVGLASDAWERYPHEFSGGQRQRVAIARALAMRPSIIVADEPVSALDVSVQAQVLELFEEVRRDFQLSMVFITHDLRVAAQMCDHIAVMRCGQIVEYGVSEQVLHQPQHDYTVELLSAARLLGPGRVGVAA